MGFLQASDLSASSHIVTKKRIGKRRKRATVVKSIRHVDVVLLREILVKSHRAEVLANGLLRVCGELGYASSDVWSVRLWPESHEREHARIQTGHPDQTAADG